MVYMISKVTAHKFASAYLATGSAVEALRQTYPETAEKHSPNYQWLKAHRMIRNEMVQHSIEAQRQELEAISSEAVARIGSLVASTDETVALNASKFAIEQTHGKATQRIEQRSQHVSVIYNLGGQEAPPIPADIQSQIDASSK